MTEYTRENMPDDLRDLAISCPDMQGAKYITQEDGDGWYSLSSKPFNTGESYTAEQHAAARRTLGLDQPEVTEAEEEAWQEKERKMKEASDGSTASYYELPPGATELQDLISHRNLNAQDGEMFRAIYRKGLASHSDALRDARKVLFYAKAEVERLEKKCIG